MNVSNTYSINISTLQEFEKILKKKNLKKSVVISQLINEWLNDNRVLPPMPNRTDQVPNSVVSGAD